MGTRIRKIDPPDGERVVMRFRANHSLSRAVGGKAVVTDEALYFTPYRFDALFGAAPLRVGRHEVRDVRLGEKDPSGALFSGGLRKRLELVTDEGTHRFVVNQLDRRIPQIRAAWGLDAGG